METIGKPYQRVWWWKSRVDKSVPHGPCGTWLCSLSPKMVSCPRAARGEAPDGSGQGRQVTWLGSWAVSVGEARQSTPTPRGLAAPTAWSLLPRGLPSASGQSASWLTCATTSRVWCPARASDRAANRYGSPAAATAYPGSKLQTPTPARWARCRAWRGPRPHSRLASPDDPTVPVFQWRHWALERRGPGGQKPSFHQPGFIAQNVSLHTHAARERAGEMSRWQDGKMVTC